LPPPCEPLRLRA